MIQQVEFALAAKHRGCHLVTREIIDRLPKPLPKAGLLNLFVKHTSCALSINENADPDVRSDMEKIMNHIVRENEPYYDHVLEVPTTCRPMPRVRSLASASASPSPTEGSTSVRGRVSISASSETMVDRGGLWLLYMNRYSRGL